MKTNSRNLFILLLCFAVFFQRCTVEKRRYTSGFHVDWNSGSRSLVEQNKAERNTLEDVTREIVRPELQDTFFKISQSLSAEILTDTAPGRDTSTHTNFDFKTTDSDKDGNTQAISLEETDVHKYQSADSSLHEISKAADASFGLSKVALVTSLGWGLIFIQDFYTIAVGATLLGLGSACALLAIILACIAIRKFKARKGSEEDYYTAKRGLRNVGLFVLLGLSGLVGCLIVFGWLQI